jgi:hypothetical protein
MSDETNPAAPETTAPPAATQPAEPAPIAVPPDFGGGRICEGAMPRPAAEAAPPPAEPPLDVPTAK